MQIQEINHHCSDILPLTRHCITDNVYIETFLKLAQRSLQYTHMSFDSAQDDLAATASLQCAQRLIESISLHFKGALSEYLDHVCK
jgi:hypothetical protein